jgi:hypothetical protein
VDHTLAFQEGKGRRDLASPAPWYCKQPPQLENDSQCRV